MMYDKKTNFREAIINNSEKNNNYVSLYSPIKANNNCVTLFANVTLFAVFRCCKGSASTSLGVLHLSCTSLLSTAPFEAFFTPKKFNL